MKNISKSLRDYYWAILVDKQFKDKEYQVTLYFGLYWFWIGAHYFRFGSYVDRNSNVRYFQKGISFKVPFFELNFIHHLKK